MTIASYRQAFPPVLPPVLHPVLRYAPRAGLRPIARGAALLAVLTLAACSSSDDTALDAAGAPITNSGTSAGVASSGLPAPNTRAYFNTVIGDRVFFATDQSTLTPDAERVLAEQAQWLQANPAIAAVIEGHADERGTREYNLALGARRADAVRAFLVARGVSASRLRVVTFGKERPVSLCSNESCWSENRRGVTLLGDGPTS
ncbi:MAG: peptidoglycan-associated lipoprotein Pal [Pseudomonadota bacterium]